MSKWIDVNDKLPVEPDGSWVIAYVTSSEEGIEGFKYVRPLFYYSEYDEWDTGEGQLPKTETVTHWQPLPQPPESP